MFTTTQQESECHLEAESSDPDDHGPTRPGDSGIGPHPHTRTATVDTDRQPTRTLCTPTIRLSTVRPGLPQSAGDEGSTVSPKSRSAGHRGAPPQCASTVHRPLEAPDHRHSRTTLMELRRWHSAPIVAHHRPPPDGPGPGLGDGPGTATGRRRSPGRRPVARVGAELSRPRRGRSRCDGRVRGRGCG